MQNEKTTTAATARSGVQRLKMRDGVSLALRTWQAAANERTNGVLFILHGLGGHSGYYEEFAATLSAAGPFVCGLDRRGHGMSDGPRGDIRSWNDDALDLQEALAFVQEQHPRKKIFLLGDSWGCLCALHYVSRPRADVSGLILASPPVRLIVSRKWFWPSLRVLGEAVNNALHLRLNGEIGPPFPLTLASRDARFFEKLRSDNYTNFQMSTRYGVFALGFLARAKRLGARMTLPALVLQGEGDLLVDPKGAQKLFKVMPATDKTLIMIPGAQHTLYYDPETPYVIKSILKWFSERTILNSRIQSGGKSPDETKACLSPPAAYDR